MHARPPGAWPPERTAPTRSGRAPACAAVATMCCVGAPDVFGKRAAIRSASELEWGEGRTGEISRWRRPSVRVWRAGLITHGGRSTEPAVSAVPPPVNADGRRGANFNLSSCRGEKCIVFKEQMTMTPSCVQVGTRSRAPITSGCHELRGALRRRGTFKKFLRVRVRRVSRRLSRRLRLSSLRPSDSGHSG